MSTEAATPVTRHKHSFPCNPPLGSLTNPGPCECGKTYAQDEADQALIRVVLALMRAYGPDAWPSAVPELIAREIAPQSAPDASLRTALAQARKAFSRLASGEQMSAREDTEDVTRRAYAASMVRDLEAWLAVTGTAGEAAPGEVRSELAAMFSGEPGSGSRTAGAKLAAIEAACRAHVVSEGSCCPHFAVDILAIISGEEDGRG